MAQSFNLHVVFPPESCKPGLGVAHTRSTDFPRVLLYPPQFRTFFFFPPSLSQVHASRSGDC